MIKREIVRQMAEKMEKIEVLQAELDQLEGELVGEIRSAKTSRPRNAKKKPKKRSSGETRPLKKGTLVYKVLHKLGTKQWRAKDLAEAVDGSQPAVGACLNRLCVQGLVNKVKRGVYEKVTS